MTKTVPSWAYRLLVGLLAYSLIAGYLILKIWQTKSLSTVRQVIYTSELVGFICLLIGVMVYYWREHNERKLFSEVSSGNSILIIKAIIGILVTIGYLVLFAPIITKDIETWSISPVLLVVKIVILVALFIRLLIVLARWFIEPGFFKIGK